MNIVSARGARSLRAHAIVLTLVCFTRGALIAVLMLVSAAAAVASEMSYRLAGIISDGSDGSIAVIELPDGRQRLVRAGDTLRDGTIVEITRTGVRIKAGNEELLLRMRGNPRLASAIPSVEAQAGATGEDTEEDNGDPQETDEEVDVRNQQLSAADTARMLDTAQGGADATDWESPTAETVGRQLNAMLEIPEGATITEVDGVRVDTPQAAIAALQSSLQHGTAARLTVRDAGRLTTVLVEAASEQ